MATWPSISKTLGTDPAGGSDNKNEVVPGDDPKKILSCSKIWYDFLYSPSMSAQKPLVGLTERDDNRVRISSHPGFVGGELDMDGLCSALRNKAKRSGGKDVVAESDVRGILVKVGIRPIDI